MNIKVTQLIKQLGDPGFQASLLADSRQALREAGVDVPATTEIKVVRNSKDSLNVIIPPNIQDKTSLSDEELEELAAGEAIISILVGATFSTIIASGIAGGLLAVGLSIAHSVNAFD